MFNKKKTQAIEAVDVEIVEPPEMVEVPYDLIVQAQKWDHNVGDSGGAFDIVRALSNMAPLDPRISRAVEIKKMANDTADGLLELES